MGGGFYDTTSRAARAASYGYTTKSAASLFASKLHKDMDPDGLTFRESRDSDDHPKSIPIVISLDVTGSMGRIPHQLVKEDLPKIMSSILQNGIPDPQVLFLGIGDHECDDSPLQVGQFESSDELLDKWLTSIFLEGGGGGNAGESYSLAWLLAGKYTRTDHFEKRGQKGILFTIGDEPVLPVIPVQAQTSIFGPGEYNDISMKEALKLAQERYHVFHIHTKETFNGTKLSIITQWMDLLGDHLLVVENHTEIASLIANKVASIAAPFFEDKPSVFEAEDVKIN